jgi:glycosyltransferase involved in cell wall biosynthesis
MTHVPAVSVMMPVYNALPYVAEAVRSILTQTMGDFELVVIDDGSTDGSKQLLEAQAARGVESGAFRCLHCVSLGAYGRPSPMARMAWQSAVVVVVPISGSAAWRCHGRALRARNAPAEPSRLLETVSDRAQAPPKLSETRAAQSHGIDAS